MSIVVQTSRNTRPAWPRIESPERWTSALARAIANGLDPLELPAGRGFAVESSSKHGTAHLVDAAGVTCTCEAGQAGDPVCQHRAAVRMMMGALPGQEPEPVAIVVLETQRCPDCAGTGYAEAFYGDGLNDYVPCPCGRCRRTGRIQRLVA